MRARKGRIGLRHGSNGEWFAPRRQPLVVLFFAAALGIGCDSAFALRSEAILGLAVAGTGVLWWMRPQAPPAILLSVGCVGAFWLLHRQVRYYEHPQSISRYVSEERCPVVVRGTIQSAFTTSPDRLAEWRGERGHSVRSAADVTLTAIRIGQTWRPCRSSVHLTVQGEVMDLLPGDHVQLAAIARRVRPPTNPGEFDARRYYAARQQTIRLTATSHQHIVRREAGGVTPKRLLAAFGQRSESLLANALGRESSALAAAIVLGRRDAVDKEVRDALLETGTVHLLAVSGLHLAMLSGAVWFVLAAIGVRPWQRTVITLLVAAAYMGLTGGRPPVVRAFLLLLIWLIGTRIGRPRDDLNALAAVGFLLLLYDPTLLTQPGPQLSFLAVGVLLYAGRSLFALSETYSDPVDHLVVRQHGRLRRMVGNLAIRARCVASTSGWVSLFTAPLIWHQFHIVSFISVVANVLVSPLMGIALIAGMLTVSLGALSAVLATPFALLTDASLRIIVWLVYGLADIPFGHAWLPSPPTTLVAAFYVLAFIGIGLRFPVSSFLVIFAGWMGIAFLAATRVDRPVKNALRVTFIDVGHGTSVLLQYEDENWLYDAGRLGDPTQSSRPIEALLWSYGIARLDGVILSHADADHYNALRGLDRRFTIDQIIVPDGFFDSRDGPVIALRRYLRSRSLPVRQVSDGDRLTIGSVVGVVQHPPVGWEAKTDNARSLVLAVPFGPHGVVLPGDLEDAGMQRLVRKRTLLRGGVLMGPHHGSTSQSPAPLLKWCQPRVVVISGGSRAAQPAVTTLAGQTGAAVFVTARDGAIRATLRFDGSQSVEAFAARSGWQSRLALPSTSAARPSKRPTIRAAHAGR